MADLLLFPAKRPLWGRALDVATLLVGWLVILATVVAFWWGVCVLVRGVA